MFNELFLIVEKPQMQHIWMRYGESIMYLATDMF